MPKSSLQQIILTLQQFWAEHGCLIAQPYYTQVGAGTMNPATFLRVLGPEPWNVAYVEPSVRPDDGRYGENPNRFQLHTQYQVILKPDPGNPQELYLESLKALGIDPRKHDVRFVEDDWEQPAISAWGLGWEVWLDGQEITQFTYFQQMGGLPLDPVSVELTYGLERILIALNNAKAIWGEPWGANISYGEIRRREEFEHSKYYFETADVERTHAMYELFSAEAEACLAQGLVLPAHDYVLKCSHAFNILDTRGAISVAERQAFFKRIRQLARGVAEAYLEQRKQLEYPLLTQATPKEAVQRPLPESVEGPADFVLEIGVEELPAADVDSAVKQLQLLFKSQVLDAYRLKSDDLNTFGTPRRLVVYVKNLAARGEDLSGEVKGPPESVAFDKDGKPTQALLGWIKKNGLPATDEFMRRENLVQERDGGRYVVSRKISAGSSVSTILPRVLPNLMRDVRFDKSMRWNQTGVVFSRPIRWIVALFGETVIPFEYAGVASGNLTRGLRPNDSPEIEIHAAGQYLDEMRRAGIVLSAQERRASILEQVSRAAGFVGGEAMLDNDLFAEVTNLVEKPTAVLGNFPAKFLELPREVLVSVMKKHQRYFPIEKNGRLLPNFVAIRNGDDQYLDGIQQGNEAVLGARFADADFFVREDLKRSLEDYRARLRGLMFHARLGSMFDKTERIQKLVNDLIPMLGLKKDEAEFARRAARLCKADLVTKMVTEMTSLQGTIGREYALRSREPEGVATAIFEHYLPRFTGDQMADSRPGLVVGLADNLDNLVSLMGAGITPNSTKDPFALRRAALSIALNLVHQNMDFDLRVAIELAARYSPIRISKQMKTDCEIFIVERLRNDLLRYLRHDVVDAVLAQQGNNPAGAWKAVPALKKWVERDDWKAILPAFARCVRITRGQKKTFTVNPKALIDKEEKALYAAVKKAETLVSGQRATSAANRKKASVDSVLNAFVPMIPAVNAFFDKVLVMADKKALRENRLGLLQRVSALSDGVVDLSRLEGF